MKPMAKKRNTRVFTKNLGGPRPGSKRSSTPFGIVDADGNVYIDPRQCKSEMLDTLIHEMLHIAYPRMSEQNVRKGSLAISTVLWRKGYRLTK